MHVAGTRAPVFGGQHVPAWAHAGIPAPVPYSIGFVCPMGSNQEKPHQRQGSNRYEEEAHLEAPSVSHLLLFQTATSAGAEDVEHRKASSRAHTGCGPACCPHSVGSHQAGASPHRRSRGSHLHVPTTEGTEQRLGPQHCQQAPQARPIPKGLREGKTSPSLTLTKGRTLSYLCDPGQPMCSLCALGQESESSARIHLLCLPNSPRPQLRGTEAPPILGDAGARPRDRHRSTPIP